MPEINEWTFAADVCKTIQGIVTDNPGLPFAEAKVEQGTGTGRKRRDLTLYGRDGKPVLTGEIKLPDRPDGQSPYSDPLIEDAFQKANAKGVEHFFTWNVNRFVLWKTFEAGKPIAERDLEAPLGASETLQITVNERADWRQLAVGNIVRLISSTPWGDLNRRIRIIEAQPVGGEMLLEVQVLSE